MVSSSMPLLRHALQPDVLPVEPEAAWLHDMCRVDRHNNVITAARNRPGAGIIEAVLEGEGEGVARHFRRPLCFGSGAVRVHPRGVEAHLHGVSRLLYGQLKNGPAP